jgi:hypothetical protein
MMIVAISAAKDTNRMNFQKTEPPWSEMRFTE